MLLNIYPQIALVSFFQNQKALHMLNNNNNNNKTSKLENFRDIICHLKKKMKFEKSQQYLGRVLFYCTWYLFIYVIL